jgi:hypothetical protein
MSHSKPHGRRVWTRLFACLAVVAAAPASAIQFVEAGSFAAPGGVTQLAYAPAYNLLAIRNGGSGVTTLNVVSGSTALRLANVSFTDLTIAPDGRHIFVADYGGENIGYGTPAAPSYVHRLDAATMTWDAKSA